MNEYKGIMPTKIGLTLEQSQQGVSNEVLAETRLIHNLSVFTKMNSDIEERRHGPSDAMHNPSQPFKFLSTYTCLICHGDTYKRRCCSLIPAESDSLPHAHTQTTKTYYKHQESRIKKAQVLKTKTSANSDKQDLPLRYQVYQGRLLASFQDDAKYEHVGQDTRSQDGKDDQD
ncbi:hypothetical protein Tco_1276817 [Tanacetum coccineum]